MYDNEVIRGLCTDLLTFLTVAEISRIPQETVNEGCVISHRLKWDPLPLNEVGRIAQNFRKGKGRNEGKDGLGMLFSVYCY